MCEAFVRSGAPDRQRQTLLEALRGCIRAMSADGRE